MQIHVSTEDGVPIYLQIVRQVKYLIATGRLTVGDSLPPIRALAQQLLVNPNTVARAYRELESAGLLTSRQGSGTRVSSDGSPLSSEEKRRILSERADSLLVEARQLGVGLEEVVEILRKRDRELGSHHEEHEDN